MEASINYGLLIVFQSTLYSRLEVDILLLGFLGKMWHRYDYREQRFFLPLQWWARCQQSRCRSEEAPVSSGPPKGHIFKIKNIYCCYHCYLRWPHSVVLAGLELDSPVSVSQELGL